MGVRLAAFNLPQIAKLTCADELDLASIGKRKVALFCCIPDADTSLNYLVGMIYSQLFQTLYHVADRECGGRLPVHVHCIMDEFPNVALPDDFDKILATMRSREISVSIMIQNMINVSSTNFDLMYCHDTTSDCLFQLYTPVSPHKFHFKKQEVSPRKKSNKNHLPNSPGRQMPSVSPKPP